MSKAEERALEKYPFMSNDDKEGLEALKYIGMECECVSVFNEVQGAKQAYFIEDYHQAEKDLELTWEDMREIDKLSGWLLALKGNCDDKEHYTEVLKRFNKERKEK